MPSLLHKNIFFDASSGRQFVAADDGFYWKEAKKSPDDSKVTRLMKSHGWELKNGNDVWLIFKRRGQPGELFVIRGEKKWYFDTPGDDLLSNSGEGQGLDSLQRALQSGAFGGKAKAMHAAAPSIYCGPERRKDFKKREEWDRRMMYDVSINSLREALRASIDPAERQEIEQEILRLQEMQRDADLRDKSSSAATAVNNAGNGHHEVSGNPLFERRVGTAKPKCPHCGSTDYGLMPTDFETAKCNDCGKNWDHGIVDGINNPYSKAARKPMHDDSGARTGLRMRPDYGESDSYTSEMNEANAKGASILVLNGGAKVGSKVKDAKMFVTGALWSGMELDKFTFSPDPRRAYAFPKNTARNLASQLKGKFGVTAKLMPAKG